MRGRGRIDRGGEWALDVKAEWVRAHPELFPDAERLATLVFIAALQLVNAGWSGPLLLADAQTQERFRTVLGTYDDLQRRLCAAEALLAEYGKQARLSPGHPGDIQGGTTTRSSEGLIRGGTTTRLRPEEV